MRLEITFYPDFLAQENRCFVLLIHFEVLKLKMRLSVCNDYIEKKKL